MQAVTRHSAIVAATFRFGVSTGGGRFLGLGLGWVEGLG